MSINSLLQLICKLIHMSHLIHHQYIMGQGIACCENDTIIINIESSSSKTFFNQWVLAT